MAKQNLNTRNPGLALGGGAVLGAAHIGVLRAMEERELTPCAISGTSIGGFIGALYAFGTQIEELEKIAEELDWLDITNFKLSKLGLLANEKMGKKVLDVLGKRRIEESPIPLAMVATDLESGEKVVLREGPLHRAVMASSCLPGIFVPVEWENKLLVDGFLCENVPVSPLSEMGAEEAIAVDLTSRVNFKKPDDLIDVLTNTFDIALNNMVRTDMAHKSVILIQPQLSAYNKADTRKIRDLIDEGYREACGILDQIEILS
ncbi:MAG: patatin-like phospholipase family protein [Balneolaceae bacterium]